MNESSTIVKLSLKHLNYGEKEAILIFCPLKNFGVKGLLQSWQTTGHAEVNDNIIDLSLIIFVLCDLLRRGTAQLKSRGGASPRRIKITPIYQQAIERWIEEKPDLTLRILSGK